jgi:hypothetical protein
MRRRRTPASVIAVLLALVLATLVVAVSQDDARAAAWPYNCEREKRPGLWQDPDTKIWWECKRDPIDGRWKWVPLARVDGNGRGGTGRSDRTYNSPTCCYSWTASALGTGIGGGHGETYMQLRTAGGGQLPRPLAVRMKLYRFANDRWNFCRDTEWLHGGYERWSLGLRWNWGTKPDCGNGAYTVNAAGIWWAHSTNKWNGGWVNSGPLHLPPSGGVIPTVPPAPTENESTPSSPNFTNPTPQPGVELV